MDQLVQLVFQIVGLAVGLVAGGFNERKHLRRLDEGEAAHADLRVTNLKRVPDPASVAEATLVMGHVVIATDYWKSFVTTLKKLVGGELRAALSLMQRARREATLRMLAEARALGAHEVHNVRYQFCSISQMRGNKGAMQVELLAYGTAVRRADA